MEQASAVTIVMWARGILNEMGIQGSYADNQEAIKLVNDPIFQKRTEHIAVKYHYTRDLVSQGAIKLLYGVRYLVLK
jgi:hypothetical protein